MKLNFKLIKYRRIKLEKIKKKTELICQSYNLSMRSE
jgi:hypothetical protein